MGGLAAFLASIHEMPVAPFPQLWKLKMSLSTVKCSLVGKTAPPLKSTGSSYIILSDAILKIISLEVATPNPK